MGALRKQSTARPVTASGVCVSTDAANTDAPHTDGALLALGREHDRLMAAYADAGRVTKAAYAAYEAALPRPVLLTEADARMFLGLLNCAGRPATFALEYLKKWEAAPHLRSGRPIAEARAKELIEAAEAHLRAQDRAASTTGLTEAGDREDEIYEALCEVEESIVAAPCSTVAGVVIKAKVARRLLPDTNSVDNDWSDTVALSVIDALMKLGAH